MKKGKSTVSVIINVLLVIVLLAAAGLGAAVYLLPRLNRVSEQAAPEGEPEHLWEVLSTKEKPDGVFAAVCRPNGDFLLGFRLFGETSLLEFRIADGEASAWSIAGGRAVLLKSVKTEVPGGERKITVFKSADEVSIARGNLTVLRLPLEHQSWRSFQWLAGSGEQAKFSYQKIGPLYFTDNFMHGEGELGEWRPQSGEWSVHALKTPVRSANPFSFLGKGSGAEASAGYWFWRNYRTRTAVQPLPGGGFGMKIMHSGEHSYRLTWSAEQGGTLTLDKPGDARFASRTVKAQLRPGFWYNVEFTAFNGLITAAIDGNEIISAVDEFPIPAGQFTLTADGEGAIFDDVSVEPADSVRIKSLEGKLPFCTTLVREDNGAYSSEIRFTGMELGDSTVSLKLPELPEGASVRIQSRIAPGEYTMFSLEAGTAELTAAISSYEKGKKKILASTKVMRQTGSLELSFTASGREAYGELNGKTLCLAKLHGNWKGGAAVKITSPSPLQPRDIVYRRAEQLNSIEARVATFSHERSMQNWNDPVQEWKSANLPETDYWNRSDFWGDLELDMITARLRDKGRFGLSLGAQGPGEAAPTVIASLIYETSAKQLVFKGGGLTRKLDIPNPASCRSLGLEKRGDKILARINGELVWNAPSLARQNSLLLAGRTGKGNTADWAEAVSVRAAGVYIDLFDKAPAAWLPSAGQWEVTNRWQCDPRWSFFSGTNLKGPACIWGKTLHGENATLEFFAGPKMDRNRGGNYEYAGDFNLVLAADGANISSGYSVMFGGWNDRGTQIVRGKSIAAENTSVKIPRNGSIHHRWFHIKARKHGGRIQVWIDGKETAVFDDPEPLNGRNFGIWTWKNGFMIAQLRLSTGDELPMDTVNSKIKEIPETPYN